LIQIYTALGGGWQIRSIGCEADGRPVQANDIVPGAATDREPRLPSRPIARFGPPAPAVSSAEAKNGP